MARIISWYSCGAASTIATKLALQRHPDADFVVAYCDTGAEHPDNIRYMADCERWFGRPVTVLKSQSYADTWDVWVKRRFLAGVKGAPCTTELKVVPRLEFQRPGDVHVFGYTADSSDVKRAANFRANFFELEIETPLIDLGVTKANCLAILVSAGIAPPVVYALGFNNNNCLPCVKATSPNYWALVRKEFPEKFDRMAKLSRELRVRLTRIKGERRFIDEIPADWPTTEAIAPACDFLCQTIEDEMRAGDGR